jgi:antitoxin component of MazEF toxin-antitoxin module
MPVFESSRKVQVFGSSLAVTLPAFFVKANEIEKGSVGKVYYGLEGILVVSLVDDLKAREGLTEIIERLNENCKKNEVKKQRVT